MRKVGLIGGISWVSTAEYYRLMNEGVNRALGGLNFAECMIYSLNYADVKKNNDNNDWEATYLLLSKAAEALIQSGAEALLLGANTMHYLADRLQASIEIPLIHIGTETARLVAAQKFKYVALLGTRFTMELDFFRNTLEKENIHCLLPEENDKAFIHQTIGEELGRGIFLESTRARYVSIIEQLASDGAQGVILGCTEIPLLVKAEDVSIPVFDTTAIHAAAAVRIMIGN